ncbi:MAG: radical SAM/SPASM domain-containing protein [Bacteroidota bacterium]
MFRRLLTLYTHRIYNLPIVVLMPHSRCNCRCVMCDIWKANHQKREISADDLRKHAVHFEKLGVREVVFSGGEALMHSNLWTFCEVLKEKNILITLLSTGLLLEKNAQAVIEHCHEVIVSLDGSREIHNKIRNIPDAFDKLAMGVKALKNLSRSFRVSARCVLQRYNYADFVNTVRAAREIGLDRISFLAADISTSAFNHEQHWGQERISEIALSAEETRDFEQQLNQAFTILQSDFEKGFIAESPTKMKKIVQYYKAVNGLDDFPTAQCNAPWVSAVIESDGNVKPCFFHESYGNIYQQNFSDIINTDKAIHFRKSLRTDKDPICRKCVCSLKLGVTEMN